MIGLHLHIINIFKQVHQFWWRTFILYLSTKWEGYIDISELPNVLVYFLTAFHFLFADLKTEYWCSERSLPWRNDKTGLATYHGNEETLPDFMKISGGKKKTKTKKKNQAIFFKFENKVLQKTGTLWSNHRLLIKQKQGNEKSVQVHTGLININIILHIYMCYLSCFTMVNILLIVYLQFEIWHHFIFGSRLYCVFFQHGVQIYQSSILHSGTDTWLNNLIESKLLLDRCEEVYLYVIKLRSANFCFSYNLCTNSGENWHCLEMCV